MSRVLKFPTRQPKAIVKPEETAPLEPIEPLTADDINWGESAAVLDRLQRRFDELEAQSKASLERWNQRRTADAVARSDGTSTV